MHRPIFLHVLAMIGIALAIGNWAIAVAGSVDAHSMRPAIAANGHLGNREARHHP